MIIDVSASTEAFVGTVCLIAVRRSVSGKHVVVDVGELVRPLVSVHRTSLACSVHRLASAPVERKPKLWKRYIDDILEVIKKHGVDGLTQHLNSVDDTGSINFTAEQEHDDQMPFLDTLIVQKPMEV